MNQAVILRKSKANAERKAEKLKPRRKRVHVKKGFKKIGPEIPNAVDQNLLAAGFRSSNKVGADLLPVFASWLDLPVVGGMPDKIQAADYLVRSFAEFYDLAQVELHGKFSPEQLTVMLDIMRGVDPDPKQAGRILTGKIRRALAHRAGDHRPAMLKLAEYLEGLHIFYRMALEYWCWNYWAKRRYSRTEYIRSMS